MLVILALTGCSSDDDANGAASANSTTAGGSGMGGMAGAAGAQTGETAALAWERLDCDLPQAVEFCGGATCHYAPASPDLGSGLALWDRENQRIASGVENRLVDEPASYQNVLSPGNCPEEPELLVDSTDVENSLILKKLTGTQTCGDEMPKFPYPEWGTTANPGEQREEFVSCIRDWLTLLVQDYNDAP